MGYDSTLMLDNQNYEDIVLAINFCPLLITILHVLKIILLCASLWHYSW